MALRVLIQKVSHHTRCLNLSTANPPSTSHPQTCYFKNMNFQWVWVLVACISEVLSQGIIAALEFWLHIHVLPVSLSGCVFCGQHKATTDSLQTALQIVLELAKSLRESVFWWTNLNKELSRVMLSQYLHELHLIKLISSLDPNLAAKLMPDAWWMVNRKYLK